MSFTSETRTISLDTPASSAAESGAEGQNWTMTTSNDGNYTIVNNQSSQTSSGTATLASGSNTVSGDGNNTNFAYETTKDGQVVIKSTGSKDGTQSFTFNSA